MAKLINRDACAALGAGVGTQQKQQQQQHPKRARVSPNCSPARHLNNEEENVRGAPHVRVDAELRVNVHVPDRPEEDQELRDSRGKVARRSFGCNKSDETSVRASWRLEAGPRMRASARAAR